MDFGDRIKAALGVLAFASAEPGTRVILDKILVILVKGEGGGAHMDKKEKIQVIALN